MHLNSLRVPTLASVYAGTLLAAAAAPLVTAQQAVGGAARPAAPQPKVRVADDTAFEGLPKFLLLVPGGSVEMGLEAGMLIEAAQQVVSPEKPELAARMAPKQLITAMRRSASTLGRRRVEVQPFLLGRWLVKCSEYEPYLAARRKAGDKVRPPFGWWRIGRKDDYEAKLPDINKLFPKDPNGPLNYWDRFGHELPYALVDDKGQSIADHPVTYVSWREANDFAARWGMRLPTEEEWTRAARGDGKHVWPLAKPDDPSTDRFTPQLLKDLRMFATRDQVAKPVGTVQAAAGPYGHLDMFGQVWQLVGELGYRPINGAEPFAAEWKKLQQHKTGQLLQSHPIWEDDRAMAKGGSFFSCGEPIQLLIDARAPMLTYDVLEAMGMRLAKSLKPGYDLMFSSLRGTYHKGPFAMDQATELAGQIGAERYELGSDGFPTAYHAVSFAPVGWLTKEKSVELTKLLERSQTAPLLLGTLAATDPLAVPAAPAGIYSVLYRKAGLPRELVDAIKQGHRELAALGKKPKGKDGDGEGKGDDAKDDAGKDKDKQDKKGSWRDVIARFGLTEQDVEDKAAQHGALKLVRIDGIEIPVEHDVFLLHGNEGKVVAAWPVPNAKPAAGSAFASELVVEADDKARAVAKFHFGVPLSITNARVAGVHLNVVLDQPAPSVDKPWRLPAVAK